MTDISCFVIMDLLPLYSEMKCTADSETLVEEHLSHCKRCSDYLQQLRTPAPKLRPEKKHPKRAGSSLLHAIWMHFW